MKDKDKLIKYGIYILSAIGLVVGIAALFPQIRHLIVELGEQKIMHKEIASHQVWVDMLFGYAMGGILLILFLDYYLLTVSGKRFVRIIKIEIRDCLLKIDRCSFIKSVLLLSGVYLLGAVAIIRSNNFLNDDFGRATLGYRGWYDWSRYVSEFLSIFIHADTNLADISPLPQLLAVVILAVGSVLLVYVLCEGKMKVIPLLASIPIGFSPYFLACMMYKYDAPYMALSILVSIVPFLFITAKRAFVFCSVISLLVMYTTYQAASGIYFLVVLVLCFKAWNSRIKTNKEIFSFLGLSILSFCTAMFLYKFFLMRHFTGYGVASNNMLPIAQLIPGVFANLKGYLTVVNNDLSIIWKILISIVLLFFIGKSVRTSAQKKINAFFVSLFLLILLMIASYGIYSALEIPMYAPRALYGFGVLLAVVNIYVVADYRKIVLFGVLALNWCLFVFAFSLGNALTEQMRYSDFREEILAQDLGVLYPDMAKNEMSIQFKNTIGYSPVVKNAGKHNPIIYRIVPPYSEDNFWATYHFLIYFNFETTDLKFAWFLRNGGKPAGLDFNTLDLPVVLKSYYHTIQSDGKRVLVELRE